MASVPHAQIADVRVQNMQRATKKQAKQECMQQVCHGVALLASGNSGIGIVRLWAASASCVSRMSALASLALPLLPRGPLVVHILHRRWGARSTAKGPLWPRLCCLQSHLLWRGGTVSLVFENQQHRSKRSGQATKPGLLASCFRKQVRESQAARQALDAALVAWRRASGSKS